jgi:hypothetical protein
LDINNGSKIKKEKKKKKKKEDQKEGESLLVEASSIDADYDPGIGE